MANLLIRRPFAPFEDEMDRLFERFFGERGETKVMEGKK